MLRESGNISVLRGEWGESVAVDALRRKGMIILERNSRPCRADRRFEIDIIAYDKHSDAIVFVEVKQHRRRTDSQFRLRSVNRRKLSNLRRACKEWRMINSYFGAVRFDVVEIYGVPGELPEVDHITNVNLFVQPERFVDWKGVNHE
jgi:Holliday junction resolvase-like predicted endonuclease